MSELTKKEKAKCIKIINSVNFDELKESGKTVEQWIENNKMVRINWKKRIKKVSHNKKFKKIRKRKESLFIIKNKS